MVEMFIVVVVVIVARGNASRNYKNGYAPLLLLVIMFVTVTLISYTIAMTSAAHYVDHHYCYYE